MYEGGNWAHAFMLYAAVALPLYLHVAIISVHMHSCLTSSMIAALSFQHSFS